MQKNNASMGSFERYLSLWVALSIAIGIGLGNLFPSLFQKLANLQYGSVNFVVAILIWFMVYPMMVSVDFSSLKHLHQRPKGLIITLVVNWLIKPFTMAGLGVLFFHYFFRGLIDPINANQYIAGCILLGAAPCTAMVFVWSQLTRGDAAYTLVQVALNDVIMIFAFAPLVAFLLGVTNIEVPWATLTLSVGLYVLIPLIAGILTRWTFQHTLHPTSHPTSQTNSSTTSQIEQTNRAIAQFNARIKPLSILGLLGTVMLLFGFQGNIILDQPALIALIAVPLLIQSYGIFALAYAAAWAWRVPFNVAAPCAFIGTSNFFELAVAVAIGLFGLHSGAALVTVVGVLVEVPVMLSLVAFANRTEHAFSTSP